MTHNGAHKCLLNAKINKYTKVIFFLVRLKKKSLNQGNITSTNILEFKYHYTHYTHSILDKIDIKNHYPKDDVQES